MTEKFNPIDKADRSLVEILLESLRGSELNTELKQTPVELQLPMLGLTPKVLDELKGKSVLDVGCGQGGMVKYMRSIGINAEGIDSAAPTDDPIFMKREITDTMANGIPRPDKSYDLITSFQNTTFNTVFRSSDLKIQIILAGPSRELYNDECRWARAAVHEMIRTTKPGRKILIFPSALKIKEIMGPSLIGYISPSLRKG